jgi:hypothetical protein
VELKSGLCKPLEDFHSTCQEGALEDHRLEFATGIPKVKKRKILAISMRCITN